MFFKTQEINNKGSYLFEALSEYLGDLSRGNYTTLDAYDSEWGAKEVWSVLSRCLSLYEKTELFSKKENTHLLSLLKKEQSIPFSLIVQYLASIDLLKIQKQNSSKNELSRFEDEPQIMLYVQAGVPGICTAYLGAIERSSLSTESKLSAMSQVIISIEQNKIQFGTLSDLVIQTSVKQWLNLFDELDSHSKTNFTLSKTTHQMRADSCLETEKANEKLTILEKYLQKILENPNNNTSKTILKN